MEDVEKSFTLVTYNLDCQSTYKEERLNSFVEQMKELKPDFIVIQEGTRDIYSKLFLIMQNMGYKRKFLPEVSKRSCGEVIFTKFSIRSAKYLPFQHTKQNRGISLYQMEIHEKKIWIGTTQLESGEKRSPLLRKQISQLEKKFSKMPEAVILAGDFQITNFQRNIKEPEGWIDAWYEAGKSSEEFTVDGKINILAEVQDRPDRIWFRSSGDLLKGSVECEDYRLVGLPKPRNEMFFASKHFGVWARFLVV